MSECPNCDRLTEKLSSAERERDHNHKLFIEQCGETDLAWDALGAEALDQHEDLASAVRALRERAGRADDVIKQAREALLYVAGEPAAKSRAFTKEATDKFFAAHEACSAYLKGKSGE